MPRPMHKTTALPRTLRDELGIKDTYGEKKRRRNGPATRKERRKEERAQKRGRHATASHMNGKRSQRDDDEDEEDNFGGSDLDSDESQSEQEEERSIKKSTKSTKSTEQPKSILKKSKKGDVSNGNEDEPVKPKLPKAVKEKLDQDDAEIAALEKRLGIKGKKLPKAFQEDGLDDLLGDLAGGSDGESKKRKREADDWLQMKRRKAQGLASDEDDEESDSDDGSDDDLSDLMDGVDEDEEEDEDDIDLDESEDGIENDEENGSDEDDDFEGFDEEEEAPKKVRENPYVAPVSNGQNKQKYIPPSLRAASSSESESLTRLRRQTQGHLNKLSEANLVSILAEIEKLYREHPRQSVTSTLTTLLLNLLCERSVLQDTFVILHAGFIAAVYKVIGMDFGAEIVQKLVETFDKGGDERGSFEGKENINLMSLLSQLYNFQVVGSTLVFDYIRMFLEKITESNTELLLKIIRNSGPQLRQDDPSALKDIVLLIQPAVAQAGEETLSVRTKFMIDTITDLKNNRMKTGVAASALSSEHITKMRKILGSLNNSRTIRATEPIRISRMDILNSSKKGKWWLVGASWRDDPLESARQELAGLPRNEAPVEDSDGEPDLVNIAKAQRMNTDVRRSIFVAIMSATDYQDAHVRLLKLRLKRAQELEIPRVLVHCAMEEQAHNPYYTLIARRICGELGRRVKVAFMFSLWDIFKKMGEQGDIDEDEDDAFGASEEDSKLETKSVVNLAKMYGNLVADGSLTLGILKNLNFAYLQPKTSMFVELLIITVIQQSQKQKSKKKGSEENTRNEKPLMEVFLRARDTPHIVKGLIYFIRKTVAKTDIIPTDKERKLVKWGCKVAVDALRIASEGGSALDA
ncbi:conserved hypothetical protein [Paecilomyces variotii No. 5]|uniref:MI domain-containing protein n=1 Tax=Byssochlamys spectabilis (strain No. 5 / NBRC 109023) TaxID=1356009 RepID=V5GCZ2_BYSSN|nr:conserved hypothetical protein [Paecilomyces variotii No. 5]